MKTRIAWVETYYRDNDTGKLTELDASNNFDIVFEEPDYCLECYTKVVVIPVEED